MTNKLEACPSGIKRWWDELRHPSHKCARLGHVMRDRVVLVFLEPANWRRYVADEAEEITPTCVRCGHTEETRVNRYRSLTGLTTDSARMRQLKQTGRALQ